MKKVLSRIFCIVVIMLLSCEEKPSKKVVFTEEAPVPIGPYSQAIRAGDHLFVAGQIALDRNGELDTSCIENECRQVLENIQNILLSADLEMKDVCKSTIYTTDLAYFSAINSVYGAYFEKDPPARETVQVAGLPKNARVEISVIAAYKKRR